MEEALKQAWRKAGGELAQLGRWQIGPSPQHVTMLPVLRVLDAMEVDENSVFADIGSGHGLVTLAAAIHSGARRSYGIELDDALYKYSIEQAAALFGPDEASWPVRLLHEDILDVKVALNWTHVYSFDKDFPPRVLDHVLQLLRTSTTWRVFGSSLPETRWKEHAGEWWDEAMRLRIRLPIYISGSREQHSIYVYERVDLPRRRVLPLSALRDESALEDSRFERALDPAFFGSEVRPNVWLADASVRVLIRTGGTDVFKGALPGVEGELSSERARMLATLGAYSNFGPRLEVLDYIEHRARVDTEKEASDFHRREQLALGRHERDIAAELFVDPAAGGFEYAADLLFRQADVDAKRSLDAYYARMEKLEPPPLASAAGEIYLGRELGREEWAEFLDAGPKPDPELAALLEVSLKDAVASALSKLGSSVRADDAIRVTAERIRIEQMVESNLLAETVPPHRIRDLAQMPGFTKDLHVWMPLFYSLFGLTRALDSSLLGKPPVSQDRFEIIRAFSRVINYMRDAEPEQQQPPVPGIEQRISAELHAALDNLGQPDYEEEELFGDDVLSIACPGVKALSFSEEEEARGFGSLLASAVARSHPAPPPLFLLFDLTQLVDRLDPTKVWVMSSPSTPSAFGYSIRSMVVRDGAGRPIVLARDEENAWHLFDCLGERAAAVAPFPVELGEADPLSGGERRSVVDPVDADHVWTYRAPKSQASMIVLLERDMDALGGLSAEYPEKRERPPITAVRRADPFETAVAYDAVLRSKAPPPELLVEEYKNTEPENSGLLVGPPAFDGKTMVEYDAATTQPLALAIAMALFRLNDSLDTALLMRYPVKEPVEEGTADFDQLLVDRFGGLVVYPLRASGWQRIVGSRLAVSSHYALANPYKIAEEAYEVSKTTLNSVPQLAARFFGRDLVRRTMHAGTATQMLIASSIVGFAAAWFSAFYFAGLDPISTGATVVKYGFKLNPINLGTGLLSLAGGPSIPTEVAVSGLFLTASVVRPVEALAHIFGMSLLRKKPTPSPFDPRRFAFKLKGSGPVDIPAFAQFYSKNAHPEDPLTQVDALVRYLRDATTTSGSNTALRTLSPVHAPHFRNAFAVFQGEVEEDDEELIAAMGADPGSTDPWLAAADVGDEQLPYFTISAFFGESAEAAVARHGRLSARISGPSGTYDLSSLVWEAPGRAYYVVIARNKGGVFWCFSIGNRNPDGHRYNDRGSKTLGTVRLSDLSAALAEDRKTLPIYPNGWILSQWARKHPFANLSKHCVFVSYNNRLLYPGK